MNERPWKFATAVATTAFVVTAVWGVFGWIRVSPSHELASIEPVVAPTASPEPKHPDRTTYIDNLRGAPTPSSPVGSSDPSDAQMDLARKLARQEYRDDRDDRRDAYVDDMHNAVQRFADDEQLDSQTADTIFEIFDAGMEYRRSQREQVQSGDQSRWEARQAIRDHRQRSEQRLIELVGEDGMARLQENLPGWGARRPRSDER